MSGGNLQRLKECFGRTSPADLPRASRARRPLWRPKRAGLIRSTCWLCRSWKSRIDGNDGSRNYDGPRNFPGTRA